MTKEPAGYQEFQERIRAWNETFLLLRILAETERKNKDG